MERTATARNPALTWEDALARRAAHKPWGVGRSALTAAVIR